MKHSNVQNSQKNTRDHELIISVRESAIALSKLSTDDLQQIQSWVDNDELEYEIFPAFDCGPGPNGPDLFDCCKQIGLDSDLVVPDVDETVYVNQSYYVETIERYNNSELSIKVTLPAGFSFDSSKLRLKHHPRYTDVITAIEYPQGTVSWTLESEFAIDEREWNFYKCNTGDLEWIDIEEDLSVLSSSD